MGMDSEVRAKKHVLESYTGELGNTPPLKIPRSTPSSWDVNSELRIKALSLMLISVNYTISHLYSLPCMKND